MTDLELRDIVLRRFYERRDEGRVKWHEKDFPGIPLKTAYRICKQLYEEGLIDVKIIGHAREIVLVVGEITGSGSREIESAQHSSDSAAIERESPIQANLIELRRYITRMETTASGPISEQGDAVFYKCVAELGKFLGRNGCMYEQSRLQAIVEPVATYGVAELEPTAPKMASEILPVLRALEAHWLEELPPSVGEREKFFPKGSQHDAYVEIRRIIKEAKSSVTIIDPYVDGSMFTMLGTLGPSSIKIQLLTRKFPGDFAHEAKIFCNQHTWASLEIRTEQRDFHDRFIIVDGSRCFHIGASIKDAGVKAFMISELEDPANSHSLIDQAMSCWGKGTVVPF